MISDAALNNLKRKTIILFNTREYAGEWKFTAAEMDSVIESYEETREEIKRLRNQLAASPTEPWRPLKKEDRTGRYLLAQTLEGIEIIFWSGQYFWDTHGGPHKDEEILAVAGIKEKK